MPAANPTPTRGPFGYDVPPRPLISDDLAMTALSITFVAVCVCLGTLGIILKRIWKHGTRGRYISSDSSIRLMTFRMYAILLAGCLLMGDMTNNLCHVWWLWKLRTSMFFWYRIAYVVTYPPVVAIGTYAVTQRCAMIVVRDSTWRKRFLKWTMVLCASVLAICSPAAVILALELQATTTNPLDWSDALLTPLWTFPIYGLLPIVTIIGALASLRASLKQDVIILHDNRSMASTASTDTKGHQNHPNPTPVQSYAGTSSVPQAGGSGSGSNGPDPSRTRTASMSGFILSHLPARPSISLGGKSATDHQPSEIPALAVRRLEANRPLTSSFRWLTGIIIVLWTLGFLFTLLRPWHPVLTSAINSALTVAGL
ncbi:hypothetical protein BCR44DRAFT_32399, partial [Catenaria anguillulae PL171]